MEENMFRPEIALCQGVDSYGTRLNTVVLITGKFKKSYPLFSQSPILFVGSLSDCRNVFTALSRFIETCPQLAKRKDSSTLKSAVGLAAPSGESNGVRKKGSKRRRIGFDPGGPA